MCNTEHQFIPTSVSILPSHQKNVKHRDYKNDYKCEWTSVLQFSWVQCYERMLRIAVTLHSNFLLLVTLPRTAFVMRCSLQWCYITVLGYISVLTYL